MFAKILVVSVNQKMLVSKKNLREHVDGILSLEFQNINMKE